ERKPDQDALMICDGDRPVALAGIMGGANSEISVSTTKVVLESAYFDPVSIRKTSKMLCISSEASQRFERGADPNVTVRALDRAAGLLVEYAGGIVQPKLIDVYPKKIPNRVVRFRRQKSNQLLGLNLSAKEISRLLKRISIGVLAVKNRKGELKFRIPTWRPDITREIDLVEEVARLHGYDKIGADDTIRLKLDRNQASAELDDRLREYLSASGYQEIITNSMLAATAAGNGQDERVHIANPISEEMSTLRTDLLYPMLTVIKHNIFNGLSSSRFYEIGNTYRRDPASDPEALDGYREEIHLLLAVYGIENPVFWNEETKNSDIFTLKGECNALLRKISLDNPTYIPYPTPTALSERSIFIEISGERVGTIGMVSTNLLKQFDLETDIFFLDLSLERIGRFSKGVTKFRHYSRYPTVLRDLAIVVDESVTIGEIENRIRTAAGVILGGITLFDIFRGDRLGSGKKSCAFSLEFIPRERTLEQADIQAVMNRITGSLVSGLNAILRE
ncbi:MAG TPA: phenylalanine--tRNA ligase subunit beta, partial [Bacteroidota bacterium]|nr:phenylalanine--tRNA ligase subunit beta [Bacteroidota bacterium]